MSDGLFNTFVNEADTRETDLVFNWKNIWYSRLEATQLIAFLIKKLKQRNLERDDFIFYYGGNHPVGLMLPFVAAYFEAIYVPVANTTAFAQALSLANTYKPKVFICDEDLTGKETDILGTESLWREYINLTPKQDLKPTKFVTSSMKIAFLTSGSTDKPKLILLNEQHLAANIKAAIAGQSLTVSDTVLATLNICHSGGLCIQTLPAIIAGAKLVLLEKFNLKSFMDSVAKFECNVTLIVPSYLKLFKLSRFWNDKIFKKFRLIGIGSSKLDCELAKECLQLEIPLLNIYGSTEAGPFAVYGWADQEFNQSVKIGRPANGIEVKFSNVTNGKILLKGVAVRPEQLIGGKRSTLIDQEGWLNTEDIGFAQNDDLYFLGRSSDIFNIGGLKVNSLDVEQKINMIPGVKSSAVFTRQHSVFNEILVACIEISGELSMTKRQIVQFCKLYLSRHMVPRNIFFFSEFPRSSIGKVLKNELKQKIIK